MKSLLLLPPIISNRIMTLRNTRVRNKNINRLVTQTRCKAANRLKLAQIDKLQLGLKPRLLRNLYNPNISSLSKPLIKTV